MSVWTHVAGTIRFDALRIPGVPNTLEPNMDQDIPEGSEGPLEFHVSENPHPTHMAAYAVSLWGDLRDYDDVERIRKYLERVTSGKAIRQGICHIKVEYQTPVVLVHVWEKGWLDVEDALTQTD